MASGLFFLLRRKLCSTRNSQSLASFSHYNPAGLRWIGCLLLTLLLFVNPGMFNTTSKCNPLTLCLDFCEFPWTFSFCLSEITDSVYGRRGQNCYLSVQLPWSWEQMSGLVLSIDNFLSQGWSRRKEIRRFKPLLSGLFLIIQNMEVILFFVVLILR